VTERNWALALVLTVAFGGVLWLVAQWERQAADLGSRGRYFVWNAAEASARFLAVAHTIVASAFLLTSRRVRSGRGLAWLVALLVASVGVCFGYAALAETSAQAAAVFFTAYFLAHDLRDESYFYEANGDAKRAAGAAPRPARLATVLVTAAIVATLGVAVFLGVGGARRYMGALGEVPLAARAGLAAAVVLSTAIAVRAVARAEGVRDAAAWRAFLRGHRPLLLVCAGAYAALFVGLWLTGRFYVIVSLHIVLWWVWAGRNVARASKPVPRPAPFTWAWVRRTPVGFHTFHAGVLVLVVGAAAVWAFGWRNDPSMTALRLLSGKDVFYYWTLVHVTVSWMPRA
jgi:hypothetical protein